MELTAATSNTMPHTYTKQELEERYKKLPEPLKDAMFSPDVAEKMFEIGKKNGLTIEKTGFMAEETGFIILGLTMPREFMKILSDRLEVDKDAAARIASDINHVILFPLREALKNAHNMEVGEAELQKEEIVIKKPAPAPMPEAKPTPSVPPPTPVPTNPQPRPQPIPKPSPTIPQLAMPAHAGPAGQTASQTKKIIDLRSLLSTPELPAAKLAPAVSVSTPAPQQTPRPAPVATPASIPPKIQQAAPIVQGPLSPMPEKPISLTPEKSVIPVPAPQPAIPKPAAPPAVQVPVPEKSFVPPPPIVIPPNPKPTPGPFQGMSQNPKNPPIDLRPAPVAVPEPAPAPVISPAPPAQKTYEGYDPYREPIE